MSQYLAALAGAGTTVAVAVTVMARTFRPTGRHRAPRPPQTSPNTVKGDS